jgi:hypothetical protein
MSERTGWRDERISRRHRQWGWDCPAVDIDFLMLEYDRGQPAALVEFKHERAGVIRISHPSVQAITNLGTRAAIPAFTCRYADNFSWYYCTPLNDAARALLPKATRLSEREWVELLYRCRGRTLPKHLSDRWV